MNKPWKQRGGRIAFFGDICLDQFVGCCAVKLNQEQAATFTLRHEAPMELRLGQAGNAASQLANFGVHSELYCLNDGVELLRNPWAVTKRCMTVPVRTRYLHEGQIVSRIDFERPGYGMSPELVQSAALELAQDLCGASLYDSIVISDYGMGFVSDAALACIRDCTESRAVFDTKSIPSVPLPGERFTILMSERSVLAAAAVPELKDAMEIVYAACKCPLVVAMGGRLPAMFDGGGFQTVSTPLASRDLDLPDFRATGASDCFAAFLAFLMKEIRLDSAISSAFLADAAHGTLGFWDSILPAELHAMVDKPASKIMDSDGFDLWLKHRRHRVGRVAMASGVCDLVGARYVSAFQEAKAHGDFLLVAVHDDASAERLKGPGRPIYPLSDRLAVLASLEAVDAVVAFSEDTPAETIERVKPDVLCKGSQHSDNPNIWGAEFAEEVAFVTLSEGQSPATTIRKIKELT